MKYMACLVMLLLTFAACSPDSDASDPGSTTNKTYTLHLICLQYQEVRLLPVQKLILKEVPIHGRTVLKKRT